MLKSAVFALVIGALALSAPLSRAQTDARRAEVVARVGTRTITVGELEDRMAAVPPFQLATFGATADAAKRKFLEDVMVPEVLFALGAADKKLETQLPTSYKIERARSSATLRAVRATLGTASDVSAEDVRKYYEDNKARYEAPERIGIWRILCKTREEALDVLDKAKRDPTPKNFQELAQAHSIDKATYLRGGNLGFVALDGTSNEAGLRVEPSVPKAASTVKDGEIVPAPVEEGPNFAVVWRRGTVGATKRTLDDATAQIRDSIWKQRVEQAEKKLIDDLSKAKVRDVNEELLHGIDVSVTDGNIIPRRRPGQVAPIDQRARD